MSTKSNKPDSIPSAAYWSDSESCWVLGITDPSQKMIGPQLFYRENGTIACFMSFQDGVPQGPMFRFHDNGEVAQLANYVEGKLTGEHRYFRSTEKTSEPFYDDGPEVVKAVAISHDDPDFLKLYDWDDCEINMENLTELANIFDSSKVTSNTEKSQIPPDGVLSSAYWSEDYQMWVVGLQRPEGSVHGPYLYYGKEGQIQCLTNFKENVCDNITVKLHPDGEIHQICNYKNGHLSGSHVFIRNESNPDAHFPQGVPDMIKKLIFYYDGRPPRLFDWSNHEIDPQTGQPLLKKSS